MSEAPILCPFEELIQSELFTLHAGKGENRKALTVHSKAIAATSAHFDTLVNGGMSGSHTKTGQYPDVEPEDIARFIEYAYRHDYTVPAWAPDETCVDDTTPPEPDEPVPGKLVEEWYHEHVGLIQPTLVTRNKFSKKKRMASKSASNPGGTNHVENAGSLRADFDNRNYLVLGQPKEAMLAAFEPQQNTAPDQDFRPVFLAHARLYAFASTYLVDALKSLTLHKLHRTLLSFQLYERRVGDVVELARYAYKRDDEDNEVQDDSPKDKRETHKDTTADEPRTQDGAMDELRQLVVDYMVLNVSTFGKHPSFLLFLQEGGEFFADFWHALYIEKLGVVS